jgi:hypothetical protein
VIEQGEILCPVEISLQQTAEETRIIVNDDGPGIPKNKVDKISEPFVKLNLAPMIIELNRFNINYLLAVTGQGRVCFSTPEHQDWRQKRQHYD